MITILGYWLFVTVYAFLLLFPVYWFSSMMTSTYIARIYKRAKLDKHGEMEQKVRKLFFRPFARIHDSVYNNPENSPWNRTTKWEPLQFAWFWLTGAMVWLCTAVPAFTLINDHGRLGLIGSLYDTQGGFYPAIIYCIGYVSEFLATYLSFPIVIAALLIVGDYIMPALLKRAASLATIINKLEKSDV